MQMGKLLDSLSEVYNSGVITISDTAELLGVAMETQDLEPAMAASEVAMSGSTALVPATNDNNVSILTLSVPAEFLEIYRDISRDFYIALSIAPFFTIWFIRTGVPELYQNHFMVKRNRVISRFPIEEIVGRYKILLYSILMQKYCVLGIVLLFVFE
jgi:hypothetical protein